MHAPDRAAELEDFKSKINLTAYMAERGYELDEKASSRNSAVMVHGDGDKLIVGMGRDEHWVYFSVRDATDHGSIIDFEQNRGGGSLGQVRKTLRPWVGSPPTPPRAYARQLEPVSGDVVKVRAMLSGMAGPEGCRRFLEQRRKVPAEVLDADRFRGRILTDQRSNAVFPHWNKEGVCGYELKNAGFTGYAPGGIKGLWCSRTRPDDQRLVVAETAIDALSYAALHGHERSQFVSTAGQFNLEQPELVLAAAEKLSRAAAGKRIEVVVAFDHDQGGRDMAAQLTPLLHRAVGKEAVRVHAPSQEGQDWNDVLAS